jgi:hypothetical protein
MQRRGQRGGSLTLRGPYCKYIHKPNATAGADLGRRNGIVSGAQSLAA